jgi:hypothetical protein
MPRGDSGKPADSSALSRLSEAPRSENAPAARAESYRPVSSQVAKNIPPLGFLVNLPGNPPSGRPGLGVASFVSCVMTRTFTQELLGLGQALLLIGREPFHVFMALLPRANDIADKGHCPLHGRTAPCAARIVRCTWAPAGCLPAWLLQYRRRWPGTLRVGRTSTKALIQVLLAG